MTPRTSYRAQPTASEAEWGRVGYRNVWGGFHGTTDTYAYVGLLGLLVKNLHRPKVARWLVHTLRDRWRHRACDTVDFHHYACTLDRFGKRLDDDYRWHRTWCERPPAGHSAHDHSLSAPARGTA